MVKRFRDLEVCKAFVHKDKTKIFEFIETMYSHGSKLQSIENFQERSKKAAEQAGLDVAESDIYDIINLQHEEVNELIYHFHKSQNSNKLQLLSTYQSLFWSYQKTISQQYPSISAGKEDADKAIKLCSSLTDECDKLIVKMEKLIKEVFPREVSEIAETQTKKIMSQESILKLIRQA